MHGEGIIGVLSRILKYVTAIQNQVKKDMEYEMEAGVIVGYIPDPWEDLKIRTPT